MVEFVSLLVAQFATLYDLFLVVICVIWHFIHYLCFSSFEEIFIKGICQTEYEISTLHIPLQL